MRRLEWPDLIEPRLDPDLLWPIWSRGMLLKRMAGTTGLEPAASAVTGQRSGSTPACAFRKPIGMVSKFSAPECTLVSAHSKKRQARAAGVELIKSVESGTTLLYSVSNGILLRPKELPETRRFESLLRHHSSVVMPVQDVLLNPMSVRLCAVRHDFFASLG